MWHKGYFHYHTSFHYPQDKRVTPERLSEDLQRLGCSFVFCAGDHGDNVYDKDSNYYWGLDIKEFPVYRETCLSATKNSGIVFIPSPEPHLMFPPFSERHEHHCCLPILEYLPKLEPPESRILASSYTREVDSFISDAHKNNVSLVLNHPYGSIICQFKAPLPLTIPSLYQMDYLELLTMRGFKAFPYNFDFYLQFLQNPASSMMACSFGVDSMDVWKLPSEEDKIIPVTFLYLNGELGMDSVIEAYNDRRSYAAYGGLYLEEIKPIPSKGVIKGEKYPEIKAKIRNSDGKEISKVEIYRCGKSIYKVENINQQSYELSWKDVNVVKGSVNYIIHIEGEGCHLITSPINYLL